MRLDAEWLVGEREIAEALPLLRAHDKVRDRHGTLREVERILFQEPFHFRVGRARKRGDQSIRRRLAGTLGKVAEMDTSCNSALNGLCPFPGA